MTTKFDGEGKPVKMGRWISPFMGRYVWKL